MDQRDDLSKRARGALGATHQMASTGCPASPQVAHRFKAFQKALPGLPLMATRAAFLTDP